MGAIGPKKKRSIHKRNVRHASWERDILKKLSNMVSLSTCTNCGTPKLAHRVCKACGYYKGKQVLTIKSKGANVIDA
ncbi:50S ribosomal protein L32 [candidate division SR1 bacterium Aalborg_AAW-1]|nr:50S ribosomal protein L32 [candidate division SR1 bacterium Aalborg_AAW-1]